MRTGKSRRASSGWLLAVAAVMATGMAGCGKADNPYRKLPDPPLVAGHLHVVTLASDDQAVLAAVTAAGWQAVALPPNYPQADAVQAGIWGVPEPVAAGVLHFRAPGPGRPDLRVLLMSLAAEGRSRAADVDEAFYRNVLGSDVPQWPLPEAPSAHVRVQAWTYLVPDIVAASKRLRAAGIPVVYDPVGITTAYMGDHRTLAIRAPDGTVVQLVQSVTQ